MLFSESDVSAVCLVLFGGQGRVGLAGQGLGGASKGFGSGGGVGGRGTGPRDGANFATCVVFLSFLKDALQGQVQGRVGLLGSSTGGGKGSGGLEGCSRRGLPRAVWLWGGRGYPPELAWWTGG